MNKAQAKKRAYEIAALQVEELLLRDDGRIGLCGVCEGEECADCARIALALQDIMESLYDRCGKYGREGA